MIKDSKDLPRHIAIIMDGNGRWAKRRKLPRVMGHQKGRDTVRMVIRACVEFNIPYLTLYAFSQENWKRPKAEVSFLMKLLDRALIEELKEFMKEGVRFLTIGHIEGLPAGIQKRVQFMKDETQHNQKLTLMLALNYGARQEIVDAVQRLYQDISKKNGSAQTAIDQLTESTFAKYLDTQGIPDPDLLIRTSGEMRLSNFLLWQASYSEFYTTPKYWPDFTKSDFAKAIDEYGRRHRRFGAIQ